MILIIVILCSSPGMIKQTMQQYTDLALPYMFLGSTKESR